MNVLVIPSPDDMKKTYGHIEIDKAYSMAKCACVSCNSCTCACSCRKSDFSVDFWTEQ